MNHLKMQKEKPFIALDKIIDLFKDPETLKELLAEIRNKKQKLWKHPQKDRIIYKV